MLGPRHHRDRSWAEFRSRGAHGDCGVEAGRSGSSIRHGARSVHLCRRGAAWTASCSNERPFRLYWDQDYRGLYLLYLAVRLWRSASETITIADAPHDTQITVLRSFFLGLATQLSNPKTAVVYASIFAAMLPSDQTWSSTFAIVPLMFAIETEVSRPARLHEWPYANYGAVALTRGPKTSCSVRGLHGCALQHAPMLGDLPVP